MYEWRLNKAERAQAQSLKDHLGLTQAPPIKLLPNLRKATNLSGQSLHM